MSDMREGICPKCGSDEVYQSPLEFDIIRLFVKRTGTTDQHVELNTFICGDCGFAENYVDDQATLQQIRQSWQRIGKQKKKNGEG